MKRILITTGMPLAGKSTFCEVLKEKGIPVVTMSHVVKEEMRSKGIEITNRSLRKYPTELRKKHGMDVIARKCKGILDEALSKNDIVALDGARGIEEIEFLRKEYKSSIVIIAIKASQETRLERFRGRGREDDEKTREEFIFRDNEELKWGVGDLVTKADYEISNEGSEEELKKNAEHVLEEILQGSE
jgi:dephospho-CoA kinase